MTSTVLFLNNNYITNSILNDRSCNGNHWSNWMPILAETGSKMKIGRAPYSICTHQWMQLLRLMLSRLWRDNSSKQIYSILSCWMWCMCANVHEYRTVVVRMGGYWRSVNCSSGLERVVFAFSSNCWHTNLNTLNFYESLSILSIHIVYFIHFFPSS